MTCRIIFKKKQKKKQAKQNRTSKHPNPSKLIAQTCVNISFRSELWAVSSKCCQVKKEKSMHIFFMDNRIYTLKCAHKRKAPVSLAWSMPTSIVNPPWMGCLSIAGLPPSSMLPAPIYRPGWRETKWSKVPCLRKQHDRWGLHSRPPDLGFEVLTARTHMLPLDLYHSSV